MEEYEERRDDEREDATRVYPCGCVTRGEYVAESLSPVAWVPVGGCSTHPEGRDE